MEKNIHICVYIEILISIIKYDISLTFANISPQLFDVKGFQPYARHDQRAKFKLIKSKQNPSKILGKLAASMFSLLDIQDNRTFFFFFLNL